MLKELQQEVGNWSLQNFGPQEAWKPLLGIGEEVGELNHAYLKRSQGIRTTENHDEDIEDAAADIIIYLCDFCCKENIDLEATLQKVWDRVKKRNWQANPEGPKEDRNG